MAQKIGGIVFALVVGLAMAWWAYQSNPTPEQRAQRVIEESMVLRASEAIRSLLGGGADLQIVDPLNPNRVAGKVFVYPVDAGYEVSGYYRREAGTFWQPWLVRLDRNGAIIAASAGGADGNVDLLANPEPASAPQSL